MPQGAGTGSGAHPPADETPRVPGGFGVSAARNSQAEWSKDVVVIGGCGHVGMPLAIAFADRGLRVGIYDVCESSVKQVSAAQLPFDEPDAAEPLARAVRSGMLVASTDPALVSAAEMIVVVIGTPVDQHLNPDPEALPRALADCARFLVDGQLVVLRSTVFPGVTALIEAMMDKLGRKIDVVFCPERIAEGRAMIELFTLPQIVGASSQSGAMRAERLFRLLTEQIIHLQPKEAELAKLFTNAWRYIKFATANQFFLIANDCGLDFERIRSAIIDDYPRAADVPAAGFAAGPCLFKDTMQLAAFNNNNFTLGHSAMLVNEGLPLYVVTRLERNYDLASLSVGILGMSFKAGSDDTRSSLSYKLRRVLQFKAGRVLCTDPYVRNDPTLVPLETVLAQADLLLIATPHPQYAKLRSDKPVVDIWNLRGQGVRV